MGLTLCCVVLSNQFVVKKNKHKTPSVAKLKEQCCATYSTIMQTIPDIMHALADVQTDACNVIQGYCEGEKNCFLERATKQQLIKYNQLLADLEQLHEKFKIAIESKLQQINQLQRL